VTRPAPPFSAEELARLRGKLTLLAREIAAAERAGDVERAVELRRRRVVECGLMWGADDVAKMTGLYAALVSAVEHIPPEALDPVAQALRPSAVRLTGRRAAA
jgi:hypothetical protein